MDLWSFGRDPFHIPVTNSYVPVRHTLMPRPDLSNKEELGHRYNNFEEKSKTRDPINPVGRLSPLQGTKMNPRPPNNAPHWAEFSHKFPKWRRKSRVHHNKNQDMRLFSTVVERQSAFTGRSLVKDSFGGISLPANVFGIPSKINEAPFRQ